MKKLRSAFTYSNVVATIALFLAVSGGVVYAASTLGKNSVKSKNIAPRAIKSADLAKGAVKTPNLGANAVTTAKVKKQAITGAKVKKGTLSRTNLATGTLAGLQVLDVSAAVPGLTTETPGGAPIPLSGTAGFTPVAGKSYELMIELAGTPTDVDGPGEEVCSPFVSVLVNGIPMTGTGLWANAAGTPPFNFEPVGSNSTPVGLHQAGQPLTISALSLGSSGCSAATTASLRIVVVQFG
jgi:hypothetical protein